MSVVTITSPRSRPTPPPLNLLLVGGAEIHENRQVSDAYIPPGSPMSLDPPYPHAILPPTLMEYTKCGIDVLFLNYTKGDEHLPVQRLFAVGTTPTVLPDASPEVLAPAGSDAGGLRWRLLAHISSSTSRAIAIEMAPSPRDVRGQRGRLLVTFNTYFADHDVKPLRCHVPLKPTPPDGWFTLGRLLELIFRGHQTRPRCAYEFTADDRGARHWCGTVLDDLSRERVIQPGRDFLENWLRKERSALRDPGHQQLFSESVPLRCPMGRFKLP